VIEGAKTTTRADTVFRLASLPKASVEAVLITRGIDPSNISATVEAIAGVGIPLNAEEAVNFSFGAQPDPPPYPIGRFGDGTYPVFYSALEAITSLEEVRYHRREEFAALQSGAVPFARYFTVIKCEFGGVSLILRGREGNYPDLVSPTEAGYPFCQAVARWAQGLGAQALHTTSARQPEGTCVPVFKRECLSNAEGRERYRIFVNEGNLTYEELPLGQ
jgi:hypothetical protein